LSGGEASALLVSKRFLCVVEQLPAARRYSDFPAPVAQLRQAMIWDWREVDKWAKENDMPKRRRD
jgi:hypothetical protein